MRNKYVFEKDDRCISLYKVVKMKDPKSKNHGEDINHLIGHYSDLECVVKKLVYLELIEGGTVSELLTDLKRSCKEVNALVKEALK